MSFFDDRPNSRGKPDPIVDPNTCIQRAKQFQQAGRMEEALKECDEAVKASGSDPVYLFEKAKMIHFCGLHRFCIDMINEHMPKFREQFHDSKLAEVYLIHHQSLLAEIVSEESLQALNYPDRLKSGLYFGETKGNKPHGTGVMLYHDGDVYAGQWCRGKEHGTGTLYDEEGPLTERWHRGRIYHAPSVFMMRSIIGLLIALFLMGGFFAGMQLLPRHGAEEPVPSNTGEPTASVPSASESPDQTALYVTVPNANIRSEPSLQSKVVAVVQPSERLTDLDSKQTDDAGITWLHVRTESGAEGWVSSKIVIRADGTKVEGSQSSLPSDKMLKQLAASQPEKLLAVTDSYNTGLDLRFHVLERTEDRAVAETFYMGDETQSGGIIRFTFAKPASGSDWTVDKVEAVPASGSTDLALTAKEAADFMVQYYHGRESKQVSAALYARGTSNGSNAELTHKGAYYLLHVKGNGVNAYVAVFTHDGTRFYTTQ